MKQKTQQEDKEKEAKLEKYSGFFDEDHKVNIVDMPPLPSNKKSKKKKQQKNIIVKKDIVDKGIKKPAVVKEKKSC